MRREAISVPASVVTGDADGCPDTRNTCSKVGAEFEIAERARRNLRFETPHLPLLSMSYL